MKMKSNVQEIKQRLDNEIQKKFESKDNIIKEFKMKFELKEKYPHFFIIERLTLCLQII